jgi:biofilm PGA synthesis N-glycosyltransferase PgaC
MPETLRGLWKQRLRWATGGAQVLGKNLDALVRPEQRQLWPLLLEMIASVVWSYGMLLLVLLWLAALVMPVGTAPVLGSPLLPHAGGVVLGAACLTQFAFSTWMDARYDRGLARNLFWMIWYPVAYWTIGCATTVVGYPRALARRRSARARWVSPDRGIRP